jgi:NitT/TauT family transport system permease protein
MNAVDNSIAPQVWLALQEKQRRQTELRHHAAVWMWRVLVFVLFLGIWQIAADRNWINPFFTSSPFAVYLYLQSALASPEFWSHVGVTVLEAGVSFLVGSIAAILFGFFLAQNRVARDATRPLLIIMNSMPRVALAPLLIIWFGLGIGSKIAVGISLTFFVVLNGTLVGVDSTDPDHRLLSRQLGLTGRETFYKIVLPSSVVSIFAALNLGLVYGFLGVVVAEMLASPRGLGYLIQYNAGILRTDAVLAIVVFLALLVTAIVYLLDRLEAHLLRWRKP